MTSTELPYAPPPPPAPEKKGMKTRTKVILGLVVGVVLIAIAASAGTSGAKKDDAVVSVAPTNEIPAVTEAPKAEAPVVTEAPKAAPANGAENGIGDTDDTADWDVTVNAVTNPYVSSNQFDVADPGTHFIAVDISLVNNADKQRTASSIGMLEVSDSEGFKYRQAFAGMDLPQLGGATDPGAITRGWTVFQVPDTATGLVLRVSGSITATGTTFAIG